jgi:hypothetical protein
MGSVAARAGPPPPALACPAAYRPRNPRASSLYQLLETHFETLKRLWEERFERRYGFWRACWDSAVFSYLDCGRFESGNEIRVFRLAASLIRSARQRIDAAEMTLVLRSRRDLTVRRR